MGIKFMGQQEDPELDVIEARGNVRIYDGTKRSLLDDTRAVLVAAERFIADDTCRHDSEKAPLLAALRGVVMRIDGGER